MGPEEILTLADCAIGLVETLAPHIAQLFQKGEITVEQQQALKDRIDAIRNGSAFQGSEWKVDGGTPPTVAN